MNCKEVRNTLLNKHAKIKELEITCLNISQDIKTFVLKQVEEMKSGIIYGAKPSKNIEYYLKLKNILKMFQIYY